MHMKYIYSNIVYIFLTVKKKPLHEMINDHCKSINSEIDDYLKYGTQHTLSLFNWKF